MSRYAARANVDHYLSLLTTQGLTDHNRDTITKLMVAEENKLARDLEHLEFGEERTARSRVRVTYLKILRDAFAEGSSDRAQADKLLETSEAIHNLMEQFCRQMREKVNSSRI